MRKYSYLLSLFVALALTMVLAQKSHAVYDPNAKHSKWFHDSIVNDPTVKSTVEVKAQRTYPVSTLGADGKPIIQNRPQKSTIKLGASASNVGKNLIKRTPAVAITYALTALLGKAVDWVMDADNNRIKYTTFDEGKGYRYDYGGKFHTSASSLCAAWGASNGYPDLTSREIPVDDQYRTFMCVNNGKDLQAFSATSYDEFYTQEKDISIDAVAQQVIQNANDGHAPSMEVMNDTALDMLEAGLLDAQLEAAAEPKQFGEGETDPTDPNQTPTDPETPPDPDKQCPAGYKQQSDGTCLKTEQTASDLPPFCSWASKVCDFIDWVKTEPPEPPESGEVDVQIPDSNMHEGILERLYINMPAQCPPDPILEFMGAKIPFPMSVFCQFAEMMKPLILLFAYIKGLSIIGNGLT